MCMSQMDVWTLALVGAVGNCTPYTLSPMARRGLPLDRAGIVYRGRSAVQDHGGCIWVLYTRDSEPCMHVDGLQYAPGTRPHFRMADRRI
jgi:hypothetical protein